jgi:DEAD/DEAH box helicase domain-containing protein
VLETFIEWLGEPSNSGWNLVHHEILPAANPQFEAIPANLEPRVSRLIRGSGIDLLYSHQANAAQLALDGRNVVLSTSTASGKTLAYQIPVLDRLVKDPDARALFLFPLKALERDQRDAFVTLAADTGITIGVYDGDTPESERRKIRNQSPRVLITNPDMLHMGLLAYHDTWRELFANLAYIVLDEVHTYKGIFGSHISQVLLRTLRVCAVHGSAPGFIACSATISNPGPFVTRLIGQDVAVVDRSGAPASDRHFLFVNPVLSPYTVAARIFTRALESGLKTIVFTRARKITELITTWVLGESPHLRNRISSYRAGFLPEERREIEAKLFSGQMDGVISTSALEMGIDVGGLDLCLLVGYPGTIINTWQRGGRVGRGGRPSAIVLIAGTDALDQYFLRNPHDFFGRNCEEAILDPLNKEVLKRHLPCAAAECPISSEEPWTASPEVKSVLEELDEAGVIYSGPDGAWRSIMKRPQREVDLRGIGLSYGIFLEDRKTLIGNSSGFRVFTECHEGAVYLHRTRQYLVTKLDLERQNVLVQPASLRYYTRALSETETEILGAPIRSQEFPGFTAREARLKVTEQVTAYEKRRTQGQDLIGVVTLDLPPVHFETIGIWLEIPDEIKNGIQKRELNFMGGIHAVEHAAISVFPLFALCDRDDIGGVGLSHRAFDVIQELLEKTKLLVASCPCETGCPSCIHSPKCGNGNKPLDKQACLLILEWLLNPKKMESAALPEKMSEKNNGAAKKGPKPDLSWEKQSVGLKRKKHGQPTAVTRDKRIFRPLPEEPEQAGSDSEPHSLIFPDLSAENNRTVTPTRAVIGPKERGQQIMPIQLDNMAQAYGINSQEAPIISAVSGLKNRKVVFFDLETQKLAQEVGGWRNVRRMQLSIGVAHTEERGFTSFTEETVSDLIDLLKNADLVVGFNHMRFDYEVLSAYTGENLRALPNLDILTHVESSLGFRLSLDHLAQFTLGKNKSGAGTDAVKWFREGRMDLLEQYCRDDVAITRDLYMFGLENGFLRYKRKGGRTDKIPVKWEAHL